MSVKKRAVIIGICILIAVQLAVPAAFVAQKYNILRNGEAYRFSVDIYDPYDSFRGRYISLICNVDTYGLAAKRYGIIAVAPDGYSYISSTSDTVPDGEAYIKNAASFSQRQYSFELPIDRYYTNEDLAPELEKLFFGNDSDFKPYAVLRVKNGNAVIEGVYVDGVRIEDYYLNKSN